MRAELSGIVLDCADAQRLAEVYGALLGWPREEAAPGWAALSAPGGWTLAFQQVPGYTPPVWPWREGAQGQMMHLDFHVKDLKGAVRCALACGARMVQTQYYQTSCTLLDPAGHPFCLDNGQPEPPANG